MYGFIARISYRKKNKTICAILKLVTPNSDPNEPHSVRYINNTINSKKPKATSIHQALSQASPNQNRPSVEAIPLPPLNFIVTGKICPMTTKNPQKYLVKSDTTKVVPAN